MSFLVQRVPKDMPDGMADSFRRAFDSEEEADAYIDENSSPDNPFRYTVKEASDADG